ncbi:uncharacterized protein [Ptychodera flava]|uniref:uncharacterized protein n=1 Tax=Ptychodera flava TaxID=63121 RepID=UPI00396A81DE
MASEGTSDDETPTSKMVLLAEEVKKESQRVRNVDNIVKECIENNILDGTQKLMRDCGDTIATGEEMCRTLAESMQELTHALGDSQSVIRKWKNKLKHKGIISGGSSDQGKILVQLHKMDKTLSGIIEAGKQAELGAQQISTAALDASAVTHLTVSDINATLEEIYMDEKDKFLTKARETVDNVSGWLVSAREGANELKDKAEEAKLALESLSGETEEIRQHMKEAEDRKDKCQGLVDQIAGVIEEVQQLALNVETLAAEEKSSLEETENHFTKVEDIGSKVECWNKEVQDLKFEGIENAQRVIDVHKEEKETKIAALAETEKTAAEVEKIKTTVEDIQQRGKTNLAEAEEQASGSGIDNPDAKRLIKEGTIGLNKFVNLVPKINDPVQKALQHFEKMKTLVDQKKSTLKEINKVGNLVVSEKKKAKKAFDEAKGVSDKMFKAIQESKDKTIAAVLKDEIWKAINAMEETLSAIKVNASEVAASIEEFRNLANVIKKDREDSTQVVKDIEQTCEKMDNIYGDATTSINQVETGISKLKKLRADQAKKKAIQSQIRNSEKALADADDKVEKSGKVIADYHTVLERARILAKKQHAVEQSEQWAREAESLTEEGKSFVEEGSEKIKNMRDEVLDCEQIKQAVPKNQQRDNSEELVTTAEKSSEKCESNVNELESLTEEANTVAMETKQAYDTNASAEKVEELFGKSESNFSALQKHHEEAKAAFEVVKQCTSEVIASLDIYKKHRELLTVAKETQDTLEKLRQTAKDAKEMFDEAEAVTTDLNKLDLELEKMREDLKEARAKAESACERSNQELTKQEQELKEEMTEIFEGASSVEETAEKIKSLKKIKEEIDEFTSEIDTVLEECREVCGGVKITVKQCNRKTSIASAVDVVRIGKQIAEDCLNIGEDAGKASDMAAKAADECGRDTEEARLAIDNALEAARVAKEAHDEAIKAYEEGINLIKDIEMMMRQERFAGEKISEVARNVDRSIVAMHEANKKATEAAKAAYDVVDDVNSKNPKHWESFKFYSSTEEADDELLCVIRAPQGVLGALFVTCSINDDIMDSAFSNDELPFSHVIRVEPQTFTLDEPALVSFPYDMYQRSRDREIAVKCTTDDETWQVMKTNATERVFEDYKGRMFAEIMVTKFSTYFVVSRAIKENLKLGSAKKIASLCSSVERRVSVVYPAGSVSERTKLSLEVQLIDSNAVPSLKEHYPDDTKDIDAASPMLTFNYTVKPDFVKPMIVRVPLTLNNVVKKTTSNNRPKTAIGGSSSSRTDSAKTERPMSAMGCRARPADELMPQILCRNEGDVWKEVTRESAKLAYLKNDVIEVRLQKPVDKLIMLSSLDSGQCPRPKMATMLEQWTSTSLVNVLLYQHAKQKDRIIVQLAHQDQSEIIDDKLIERGFEGAPSNEVQLLEGQTVKLEFSGNLGIVDRDDIRLRFYRGRPNRVEFKIKELNPYRNFSSDSHVGTAKFYVNDDMDNSDEKWRFLVKFSVNLPKLETAPPRPRSSCKAMVKGEGLFSEEGLRSVSQRVAEDMEPLALQLGFNRVKIQRIKRDNPDKQENQVFDLLVSWRNGERRLKDKVGALCDAFRRIGRPDLVDFIIDAEDRNIWQ